MAYETSATTKGGREGRAILDDQGIGFAMGLPKAIGGAGEGFNPEQLFALGYSSCFGSALLAVARKAGVDAANAKVTAAVTLAKDETSFGLAVQLRVHLPGVDAATAEKLAHEAHAICPYSKATRNNIPVTISLI